MRIAFYAPLKAPDHAVPSGDRQMARLLVAALGRAGHDVEVVSTFRAWAAAPGAPPLPELQEQAGAEVARLAAAWADATRRPDLIFAYHPYYKAPDLLGPALAERFALPYVTAEASLAERRAGGAWGPRQACVVAAVRRACLNLCFTARDRAGLCATAAPGTLADLPPFIDAATFVGARQPPPEDGTLRLVTVAMMRHGDKLASYRLLADALGRLRSRSWRLTVVGDGSARAEVRAALAAVGPDHVRWAGAAATARAVADHLGDADILVWPGLNEAYGLCYLEAQAMGLPVVAIDNAGVPAVVRHGVTGLLTPADPGAYAAALDRLIAEVPLRQALGSAARAFVHGERNLAIASARLDGMLARACRVAETAA